ncbi:hypothetical protein L9F63_010410, partial [Diploptera punctata]
EFFGRLYQIPLLRLPPQLISKILLPHLLFFFFLDWLWNFHLHFHPQYSHDHFLIFSCNTVTLRTFSVFTDI